MNVVMIHWLDACSDSNWEHIDKIEDHEQLTVSVGFLVKETRSVLTISHTWDEESKTVNGCMHIPKKMIQKRHVLWREKKAKKRAEKQV